jgi:hypothetical protein
MKRSVLLQTSSSTNLVLLMKFFVGVLMDSSAYGHKMECQRNRTSIICSYKLQQVVAVIVTIRISSTNTLVFEEPTTDVILSALNLSDITSEFHIFVYF